MGSNVSTSNGRREAKAIAPPPHAYNRSNAHRWTNPPQSKSEVATTTRNFKGSNNENESNNVVEIIRPITFLNHSININRVISFHSTAIWREYFQASKHSDKLEAKATAAPHHAYNRSDAHRWTSEPPVKSEVATTTRNFNNSIEDKSNFVEITRPIAFLNHSANFNRVISFHSTATWREYFQASKHSDKLIVIFFSSSRCGFCRYLSPILDDLATQYPDVEMHKIDVDELFEISREFGVTVMPTLLFIKRGKEVDKVLGTKHQEIRTKIEKYRV